MVLTAGGWPFRRKPHKAIMQQAAPEIIKGYTTLTRPNTPLNVVHDPRTGGGSASFTALCAIKGQDVTGKVLAIYNEAKMPQMRPPPFNEP
ncbi:uncharacterized protein LOC119765913 isoform X1 [Culex quinquefasciatus]|uniref:uncharacterized protein LOC119765913 isoform X1 n=1 Tax=Culex quinquefasciatus TaxID=7176 RepID=UPI0018E2BD1B|nr:uncharacterized protein LOC119765913 isoform X1 [Culex quinquefasciatus]